MLFVLSDPRLPFGQLRMRAPSRFGFAHVAPWEADAAGNAYDSSNPWLRSAYTALGRRLRSSSTCGFL